MSEVKILSKNIGLAIKWAAAEYKFVKELREQLSVVEGDSNLKRLQKAAKLLRYISRAERRAYRFEQNVGKSVHDLLEKHNISLDLIQGFNVFLKQFQIEENQLVKLASWFSGEIDKTLDKERLLLQLEEKAISGKKKEIRTQFLQILKDLETHLDQAEEWIAALEDSLRQAKSLSDRLMVQALVKPRGDLSIKSSQISRRHFLGLIGGAIGAAAGLAGKKAHAQDFNLTTLNDLKSFEHAFVMFSSKKQDEGVVAFYDRAQANGESIIGLLKGFKIVGNRASWGYMDRSEPSDQYVFPLMFLPNGNLLVRDKYSLFSIYNGLFAFEGGSRVRLEVPNFGEKKLPNSVHHDFDKNHNIFLLNSEGIIEVGTFEQGVFGHTFRSHPLKKQEKMKAEGITQFFVSPSGEFLAINTKRHPIIAEIDEDDGEFEIDDFEKVVDHIYFEAVGWLTKRGKEYCVLHHVRGEIIIIEGSDVDDATKIEIIGKPYISKNKDALYVVSRQGAFEVDPSNREIRKMSLTEEDIIKLSTSSIIEKEYNYTKEEYEKKNYDTRIEKKGEKIDLRNISFDDQQRIYFMHRGIGIGKIEITKGLYGEENAVLIPITTIDVDITRNLNVSPSGKFIAGNRSSGEAYIYQLKKESGNIMLGEKTKLNGYPEVIGWVKKSGREYCLLKENDHTIITEADKIQNSHRIVSPGWINITADKKATYFIHNHTIFPLDVEGGSYGESINLDSYFGASKDQEVIGFGINSNDRVILVVKSSNNSKIDYQLRIIAI